MRKTEFRGKHKETSEWVFGFLMMPVNRPHIEYCIQAIAPDENGMRCFCEVIPETVGEFTGMLDGKNKKIFEGDIVRFGVREKKNYLVVYLDLDACFYLSDAVDNIPASIRRLPLKQNNYYMKIIGNVTDNPEMLGEII
jgi:uncharacterized phage protein (TIGR01671 family)